MNEPSWRHLRVSIIYGHHKDLIFISHARGSNWVVNSGCPKASEGVWQLWEQPQNTTEREL